MKKKFPIILIVSLLVLVIISVPLFIFMVVLQDFQVKEFQEVREIAYNSSYKENQGNVCFGNKFKCVKVNPEVKGNVDVTKIGEYKITYTYKYKNKTLVKEQTIKVKDNEAPVISGLEETYKVCPNNKSTNFTATAIDDYDGDISSLISQRIEDNKIIFTVKDSSGNTTEIRKDVDFLDTEEPSITLSGSNTSYVKLNGTYKELGATAQDNCDGDISSKIEISGSVDTSKAGEYIITYKVNDNEGNTKTITRKVYVYSQNNYVTPTGKSIYLTFDDGPGPYTGKLLDVLKKYNVPATFFVTNQGLTKGYDSMILRAYQEGHTIGLHTYTHNYSIYQNAETYFNDLYQIQDKVKRITGETSMIIRFPGGSSNTISKNYDNGSKIMSELTKAVEARGFRYFDWNVSSGDAGETTSTAQVVKNITSSLGNGSTYVVLQHDIKGFSVNAVEEVIIYALARGYTFRALTMDSPTMHHGINN